MPLATTIGPERLPGRKFQKNRVKFLGCTNVDGSEKFLMLVIGRSKQPKFFGSDDLESLLIMNRHNAKAWMNGTIFFEWLKALTIILEKREIANRYC